MYFGDKLSCFGVCFPSTAKSLVGRGSRVWYKNWWILVVGEGKNYCGLRTINIKVSRAVFGQSCCVFFTMKDYAKRLADDFAEWFLHLISLFSVYGQKTLSTVQMRHFLLYFFIFLSNGMTHGLGMDCSHWCSRIIVLPWLQRRSVLGIKF